MKLGEMIMAYREEHGNISQREFARMCGLSSVIISNIERGVRQTGEVYVPKLDTVRKLAHGMGITPEELIQCEDFDLNITVGMEETPIMEDVMREMQSRPDESMLLQAYRMIPPEHRIEVMQCVFRIKDKYAERKDVEHGNN